MHDLHIMHNDYMQHKIDILEERLEKENDDKNLYRQRWKKVFI